MKAFRPPVPLAAHHQLDGFRCRSPEQTEWLIEHARQAHRSGTTRVFVVTEVDQPVAIPSLLHCWLVLVSTSAMKAKASVQRCSLM